MTAIAWDGTTLAVDRASFCGEQMIETAKLCIFNGGTDSAMMYAGCGNASTINEIVRWIQNGQVGVPDVPKVDQESGVSFGIIVDRYGRAYNVFGNGLMDLIIAPFGADGASAPFVAGALAAGVDATRAIQLAVKFRGDAGIGVDSFNYKLLRNANECTAACSLFLKSIVGGQRS